MTTTRNYQSKLVKRLNFDTTTYWKGKLFTAEDNVKIGKLIRPFKNPTRTRKLG